MSRGINHVRREIVDLRSSADVFFQRKGYMNSRLYILTCCLSAYAASNISPSRTYINVYKCRVQVKKCVDVGVEHTGVIAALSVDIGDRVCEGQTVGYLRHDFILAQMTMALNQIDQACLSMALAQNQYEAVLKANRRLSGTVSITEVEYKRLSVEYAKKQVEIANKQLDVYKQEQKRYFVYAPFSGVVTDVAVKVGEGVREGEHVITITDPTTVMVVGYVDVEDACRIRKGQRVCAGFCWGIVKFVDVRLQPVTQKVKIIAEFPNTDKRLTDGAIVDIQVQLK